MRVLCLKLVAVFVLVLAVGSANGAIISDLHNTGVDATGTPLPDGTIGDSHYKMIANPSGTFDIRVRTSVGGYPVPPWNADDAVSAWIGPNNDAEDDGDCGEYVYQTSFTLPAVFTSAFIGGNWAADDIGTDIFINGASTGQVVFGFGAFAPFSIAGGFVPGVNTLDFHVLNTGCGPTGLRVEMRGEIDAAVPVPAAVWTGITLLGGVVVTRLARRR